MVADRHKLAAYHNKHCWRAFRRYQHLWPWTTLNTKSIGFKWIFRYFRLRCTLRVNVRWNILEIDQDNLRTKLNCCCGASHEQSWDFLLIRPSGTVVPGGLMFYCHEISQLSQPIAVKVCHMIGSMINFIIHVPIFRGPPEKKEKWHQKRATRGVILYNFRLRSRISPERMRLSKIGKNHVIDNDFSRVRRKKVRWILVH